MDYVNKIKKESNNAVDYLYKEIKLNNNTINLISIETIASSSDINDFILKKISLLDNFNTDDLYEYLFNYLPAISIKRVKDYNEALSLLLNGFAIIIVNNERFIAIETRRDLTRGVSETDYERSIIGPKDSFIEHFNTNVGLIRRRIKDINLHLEETLVGKYSKTKVGVMYLNGVCKPDIKDKVLDKLKKINIDGIIDSGYIRKWINKNSSLFPTIKTTERPDLASQALLEGKIVIITDNSPDILILPTFFIDYFHTSDDYYQKSLNISFIRIIRLIAFIIAIFLPSYYIAITTFNVDFIPINLLINFVSQQNSVPFPAFIEAFIMIITFEILRESDTRIPSGMGTAISILGGLVLGDAAVSAGILSPIMIIVIAISVISGLIFQSVEVVNAIRWWRFSLMILATFFGIYGIFIGLILIITNLSSTQSFDKDYLYPYAPINLDEQLDGFVKAKDKKIKYRNPLLSNNKVRGKIKE